MKPLTKLDWFILVVFAVVVAMGLYMACIGPDY